jgi:CPA2 family monovalent cation:H+ antiporter-2
MPESWPFLLAGGITLILFFALGFASRKLKLPSVLGFILLGIALAGWLGENGATLHYLAEIGIVLLFFILGLQFPLQRMKDVSIRVWPAGLLDVVLNLGVGLLIALLFGLNLVTALLIGAVAYATSSSITLKMLEEKKRLASPEAEFILALLIFEDLVAPVLVSFLAGVYSGAEISFLNMGVLLVKILVTTGGAILIALYGFRRLSAFVERYLEADFMPLFTIGITFAYAGLAVWLGLSEVLGAFLAGVMLSETGRSKELEHLVVPVRHVTLPFFFFWFGTTISLAESIPMAELLAVLTVWSLVAKVLVGFYGGKIYGLSPRASVRAGLSLGQRGEFSAIIAALAPPQLRAFSGVYILFTAFAGIYMFSKAPKWARWVNDRFFAGKPGPEIKAGKAP